MLAPTERSTQPVLGHTHTDSKKASMPILRQEGQALRDTHTHTHTITHAHKPPTHARARAAHAMNRARSCEAAQAITHICKPANAHLPSANQQMHICSFCSLQTSKCVFTICIQQMHICSLQTSKCVFAFCKPANAHLPLQTSKCIFAVCKPANV